MSFIIEKSVFIRKPAKQVFDFHADITNHVDWHDHVLRVTQLNDIPVGVGATYEVINKVGFRENKDTREIIAFDPPHAYTYRVSTGSFTGTSEQTFADQDGGTHFLVRGEFQFSGILRFFEGLIAKQLDKHLAEALHELKHYLEAQP